jgi:hypothetical protein
MAGSGLDRATLARLDESIEVDMATPRRDGSQSCRPIWVVVVDGTAYVRSYRGESGAWYRRARADGRATIGVDGRAIEVGVEPGGFERAQQSAQIAGVEPHPGAQQTQLAAVGSDLPKQARLAKRPFASEEVVVERTDPLRDGAVEAADLLDHCLQHSPTLVS